MPLYLQAILSGLLLLSLCHSIIPHSEQRKYVNISSVPPIIIAVGLPKSGSSSLFSFLGQCRNDIRAIHWRYIVDVCKQSPISFPIPEVGFNYTKHVWKVVERWQDMCFIGTRIHRAIADGKPPLEYVLSDKVNAVVQMDVDVKRLSIWPQIDALDLVLDSYPSALYIHHIREMESHAQSLLHYADYANRLKRQGMLKRFAGQSAKHSTEKNIELFITAARKIVRDAFAMRPGYNYIEVDIAADLRVLLLNSQLSLMLLS